MPLMISEKVINLEYGLLESRKLLSRNLLARNGNLEFNLEKTLGPAQTPPPGPPRPPPPLGVCVGGECYRGCYGYSKPGFEIKFEITVFEI